MHTSQHLKTIIFRTKLLLDKIKYNYTNERKTNKQNKYFIKNKSSKINPNISMYKSKY